MSEWDIEREDWAQQHAEPLDTIRHAAGLAALFAAVRAAETLSADDLNRLIKTHVRDGSRMVSRGRIIWAYRQLVAEGVLPFERAVFDRLRLKPVRTISGVAPVAVLTGPQPCPGECVFCPDVAGFPKSYLPDEPGAKRGWIAHFDPFEQTTMRLRALDSIGHATDKVELLILGGTWSAYPADYQEWFVRRCFDAMNGGEAASLREAHTCNETAAHRNVGLVIETRPDAITLDQVQRLRQLGVTKVQLGAQSLDNAILALNRRGHTVAETRQACRLLRLAGFKLHLHWMPNLLGATPESDRVDFARLWDDPALRPDELKLYPCSLLAGTELYTRWERGEYHPYADEVLVNLLADCKAIIPPYCRVNRVMRDIPAHYIITGSTQSHLRQVVQRALQQRGQVCRCIRCREVRHEKVTAAALRCDVISYQTDATHEYFLSYLTPQDKIAGFVRLALPAAPHADILPELHGCAVIREVHIYGPALEIGESSRGEAQHTGLGTQLIEQAAQLARAQGWKRLAVIAAIGTREYYRRLGFTLGELYMARELSGGKDGSGTGR